jgi:hypothetical protein
MKVEKKESKVKIVADKKQKKSVWTKIKRFFVKN